MATRVNIVWMSGEQGGCCMEMGTSGNVVWLNGHQWECCMGEWGPVGMVYG